MKYICKKSDSECIFCMKGYIQDVKDCPNAIIREDDSNGKA